MCSKVENMANKTLLLREGNIILCEGKRLKSCFLLIKTMKRSLHSNTDDEDEVSRSIRVREIKKYFWIIGTLSISLVILLFVLCQIGVNYNQIESISELNLNREKRSVKFLENENIDEIQKFWSQISDRKRRNIDIDQNDLRMFEIEFIRRKRLITDMKDIEDKFENCKKFQNDDRCERFFKDIVQINKLLQENVVLMDEIRKKYDKIEENKIQQVVHTRPMLIHEEIEPDDADKSDLTRPRKNCQLRQEKNQIFQ